jgi:alpha-galactosidase
MRFEDFPDAHGEVFLSDGRVLSSVDSDSVSWRIDGHLVQLAFVNTAAAPVRVEQLRLLVAPHGYRALPLEHLRIGGLGWQSWSRAYPPAPFEANLDSAGPPIRGPYLPHRARDSQVEAWQALLTSSDSAPPLLLGFTRAENQLGTLEIIPTADGGHAVIAACELEGLQLAPGAEVVSEPLLIAVGSAADLHRRYAEAVAAAMGASHREILTGWCSWYQLYTTVSEADVRRNLTNLSNARDLLPLRLIQLDDGFQHAVGDWLEINDKFPSGLRALAADIRADGFMPGLWLAPFLLSENSHTYAAHPDWVIRDDNGEPLNALHNWGSANYCLDTTNPAALDWICDVVRTVGHDWGFDYLKLDFLYAAALRGRRYDQNVTSVQAYRQGMRRIREVAGDRFILGSGAPMVASVGLVDGMRIGSDVAAYWGREGNADGPALVNALRATLARGWLQGRWWANDPDCVVIRSSDTELALHEVQAWASVVALSGGMLFVGDDVSQVEPERLDLLSRLLPPCGVAAETAPPLFRRMPQRLHLRLRSWSVVAVANWSDSPVAVVFAPAEFGLPDSAAYHLFDQWSGEYLGLCTGSFDLGGLESHALRLLAVSPDPGHPVCVGTTGHLLGPAMDIATSHWDPAQRELSLVPSQSAPPARRKAEAVVADSHGRAQRQPLGTTTLTFTFPQ